jgi:hypothetical protein
MQDGVTLTESSSENNEWDMSEVIIKWNSNLTTVTALSDCRGIVAKSTVEIWAQHYKMDVFVAIRKLLHERAYYHHELCVNKLELALPKPSRRWIWLLLGFLLRLDMVIVDNVSEVHAISVFRIEVNKVDERWSNRTANLDTDRVVWYPTSGQYEQRTGTVLVRMNSVALKRAVWQLSSAHCSIGLGRIQTSPFSRSGGPLT